MEKHTAPPYAVFNIENHYHNHIDAAEILSQLNIIKLKLHKMPTKQEFDDAMAEIGTGLTNVADDITRLLDQQAGGGLTPQEEADVFSQLRAAADKIKEIAAIVPEPPTPGG